jgi:hypothetical protein
MRISRWHLELAEIAGGIVFQMLEERGDHKRPSADG